VSRLTALGLRICYPELGLQGDGAFARDPEPAMTNQTSAQWWSEIEQNWDELMALFQGCDLAGEVAGMARLKAQRDATIARRRLAAQRRAPERRVRRRSRSWQTLADLRAEQWVHQGSA
jgi:hypothetical protein